PRGGPLARTAPPGTEPAPASGAARGAERAAAAGESARPAATRAAASAAPRGPTSVAAPIASAVAAAIPVVVAGAAAPDPVHDADDHQRNQQEDPETGVHGPLHSVSSRQAVAYIFRESPAYDHGDSSPARSDDARR